MGVVEAKIQTVEDIYRLVWAATASKRPMEAYYNGAGDWNSAARKASELGRDDWAHGIATGRMVSLENPHFRRSRTSVPLPSRLRPRERPPHSEPRAQASSHALPRVAVFIFADEARFMTRLIPKQGFREFEWRRVRSPARPT